MVKNIMMTLRVASNTTTAVDSPANYKNQGIA